MMHVDVEDAPLSDEVLADHARRGVSGAFDVLFERYKHRIYRLAYRMSHDASDAEEIVQDALLGAYRGIRSFHGESRFGTWIYRIAMNAALMQKRAAARRPTLPLEAAFPRFRDAGHAAPGGARADDLLAEKELTVHVRDALNKLADTHRAALVLRDLEELSAEQAAEILGVTPETVRQRAHRARLRLREELRAFVDPS